MAGEGIIKKVERLSPEEAWSRYSKQMFLDESEYSQYTTWSPIEKQQRRQLEISVFILKGIKKYDNPITLSHNTSPSGRYITQEEYTSAMQ